MSKEAGKMNDTILEVKDLSVTFTQYERGFSRRTIHAVEKMDLEIKSGEIEFFHTTVKWTERYGFLGSRLRKKRSKDSGDMRSFWCPRAFLTWIRL